VGSRAVLDGYSKSLPPTGVPSLDRPAPNESLHRLRYPGPHNRMCTGSFPGIKRPVCGVKHPPPFSAKAEERGELYVSNNSVLIIRRSNCINTAYGIVFCQ